MNKIHVNGKHRRCDKPAPGCLGRMVNFFDLGASGNRLLIDKPFNDGASLSRSRSDVSRMSSVPCEEIQDKAMISELRRSSSTKKPNGTPVKMLMAQEMSKDLDSQQNSPNVIAKLMGLDVLPRQQQPDLASQRNHAQCYTRNSYSQKPIKYWKEEHYFPEKRNDHEVHPHQGQNEYKDIYEVCHQSQRTSCTRDKSPQKGRCNENLAEKKLAIIRQKFMEAKRLSTDENLRRTKEYHDTLDVLSSNSDLLLKVLQEPNSLFSPNIYGGHSIALPPETKQITVLRPSKMMADDKFAAPTSRNDKYRKKHPQVNQVSLWDNHNGFSPTMSTWEDNDDEPTQPTRIVVLKPSPTKVNDVKAITSSTPSSPCTLPGENFFEDLEDEDAQEARVVAKEITHQMRDTVAGHRRDETLLSSVFSNGYTGDESSFEKSDNEFATGDLSDSEVMSPTSRHSWDYVNKYGSPYSSSFSRVSYSPESSVCREAKKRLSERWAMMASNGSNPDQRYIRRSSSTLGEMLALSDMKKPEMYAEGDKIEDQNPRGSTCLKNNVGENEGGDRDNSPQSLLRSKSVPVSSTAFIDRLSVEVSDPTLCKQDCSKEMIKAKTSKSSFTGKVTSLFFSRNKKVRKNKSDKMQLSDESLSGSGETSLTNNDHSEVVMSPSSHVQTGIIMEDLMQKRSGQNICSRQEQNQDHPSPISVLEPPFEEDERAILGSFRSIESNPYGNQMPCGLGKSNLIDKSPPIGSLARTLALDDSSAETTTSYTTNSAFVPTRAEDDEGEMFSLVQSLLSMAGLDDVAQLSTNMTRWQSPKSPLDSILRAKYIDLSVKEPLHEAKRRQLRSSRKLVFDCVNAGLVDITHIGTPISQLIGGRTGTHDCFVDGGSTTLADKVWGWMKEWFGGELKFLSMDEEGGNSLVEMVVRKEVVGNLWVEQMKTEIDNIGNQIEGILFEELIEEFLVEWTIRE